MLETLLGSEDFHTLMKKHTKEVLELLLKRGVNFSILTNIADVSFDPALPMQISQGFKPITMFFLAGYTFESTQIYNGKISFEAGFGSDNFGSLVSLPIEAILQIIIEEIPVFINLSTPPKTVEKLPKESGLKRSMEAFMSNPENQKLVKKS
ncbi:hypothetical protein [Sulfurospirillum oryzae]|uniref:hypothetical protein n=1 Tax=Sulfurospirillum oryzae TaxID=2976535 RepID=UPI0021E96F67|nr:hypothetical protein [Sulfurospirillum oryzae]